MQNLFFLFFLNQILYLLFLIASLNQVRQLMETNGTDLLSITLTGSVALDKPSPSTSGEIL